VESLIDAKFLSGQWPLKVWNYKVRKALSENYGEERDKRLHLKTFSKKKQKNIGKLGKKMRKKYKLIFILQ